MWLIFIVPTFNSAQLYRLYGTDGNGTLGYYISDKDDLVDHDFWSLSKMLNYLFRERNVESVVKAQRLIYDEFVSNGERECCAIIDAKLVSNDDAMLGIVDFIFWRSRQYYLKITNIKRSSTEK